LSLFSTLKVLSKTMCCAMLVVANSFFFCANEWRTSRLPISRASVAGDGPFSVFILLNGWICLHAWRVRLSRLLVSFRTHLKSLHFHSFIHFLNSLNYPFFPVTTFSLLRYPSPFFFLREAPMRGAGQRS